MTRPLPSTLAIHVPFTVRKRGGRKLIVGPDGMVGRMRPRIDSVLVKAIARAHRWQKILERGEYTGLTDLAAAEKINLSYMSRVLRLTLLAPDLVEALLDGRQPAGATLPVLMKPFPTDWEAQRRWFMAL